MKKTFLLLFLAIFTSAGVFADDVSEGQALTIASDFAVLCQVGEPVALLPRSPPDSPIR